MNQSSTRRAVIKTALFLAATPTSIGLKESPKLTQKATISNSVLLIDNYFASVSGWVIPIEKLTQGEKLK